MESLQRILLKFRKKKASKKLQLLTIETFIESIPGYSAQNMTLNAMIYFLFLVVAAVVGIFMYVITLQKLLF